MTPAALHCVAMQDDECSRLTRCPVAPALQLQALPASEHIHTVASRCADKWQLQSKTNKLLISARTSCLLKVSTCSPGGTPSCLQCQSMCLHHCRLPAAS